MLKNLRYWIGRCSHLKSHPGAVLLKSGEIKEFNLLDRHCLNGIKEKDVVATFTKPEIGGWKGEAQVEGLRGWAMLYTINHDDLSGAVEALLGEIKGFEAEMQRYRENPREALISLLKTHDWYYHYSDDGRVYRAGVADWKRIETYRNSVADFDDLVREHKQ